MIQLFWYGLFDLLSVHVVFENVLGGSAFFVFV